MWKSAKIAVRSVAMLPTVIWNTPQVVAGLTVGYLGAKAAIFLVGSPPLTVLGATVIGVKTMTLAAEVLGATALLGVGIALDRGVKVLKAVRRVF